MKTIKIAFYFLFLSLILQVGSLTQVHALKKTSSDTLRSDATLFDMTHTPSPYECAVLSWHVYNKSGEKKRDMKTTPYYSLILAELLIFSILPSYFFYGGYIGRNLYIAMELLLTIAVSLYNNKRHPSERKKLNEGEIVHFSKGQYLKESKEKRLAKRTPYLFILIELVITSIIIGLISWDIYLPLKEIKDKPLEILKTNFNVLIKSLLRVFPLFALTKNATKIFANVKNVKEEKEKEEGQDGAAHFNEKGWRIVKIYKHKEHPEYTGILYINKDENQMVLAHQGSTSWKDWFYTNFPAIFRNQVKGQVKIMLWVLKDVEKIMRKYHNCIVLTVTGHSLGGFLAQLCGLSWQVCPLDPKIHVKALTFDAPGVGPMLEILNCNTQNHKVDPSKLDITNYVSLPNYINSSLPQVGTVYTIPFDPWLDVAQTYKISDLIVNFFCYACCECLLLFLSQIYDASSRNFHYEGYEDLLSYAIPSLLGLIGIWGLSLVYRFFLFAKQVMASAQSHQMLNFIKAADPATGDIKCEEVKHWPNYYGNSGLDQLFLSSGPDNQLSSSMNKNFMGFSYKVESDHKGHKCYIRNMSPELRVFLRKIDQKYINAADRKTFLQKLLGCDIEFLYDSDGNLSSVRCEGKDTRLVIDHLTTLLQSDEVVEAS